MLQVTGHAGGVPIASPRGRSIEVPFGREQQILNSGTVVFLDFLEKVRNTTEKLVRDDQFRKSRYGCTTFKFMVKPLPDHNYFLCFHRISVQGYMKTFREFAEKPLRNSESAGGSQENVVLLPQ